MKKKHYMGDSLAKQLMDFIDEGDLVRWKDNSEPTQWNDGAEAKINEFFDKWCEAEGMKAWERMRAEWEADR